MAMPNGMKVKLDPENYQYVGVGTDTWFLTKMTAGYCYIATSTIANDPASVAGLDGAPLGVGEKYVSTGGPGHVYVKGTGEVVLTENA